MKRHILPKDKTYPFEGANMHYSVIGTGKPVILLHGSMIADPWGGFDTKLARGKFRVYLPHLPGFGASDAIKNKPHNTVLFADALAFFIKFKKLQKVPIIAFSLGTVVATRAMIRHTLPNTLLLAGTPIGIESDMLKNASLMPVWLRRAVASTVWGRKRILIPVLRDILGDGTEERDRGLLNDLTTTDTKSLVDINMHQEVNLQMKRLLQQINNEVYYLYGDRDALWKTARHYVKKPIVIKGAEHNIFTSEPNKTLAVINILLSETAS